MNYVVYRETVNDIEFVVKYNDDKGFHYITVGNKYTIVVFKNQDLDKTFDQLKKDVAGKTLSNKGWMGFGL